MTTSLDPVSVATDSVAFLKGKQSANIKIREKYHGTPIPILATGGS